jgi:hypothetical protein
MKKLLILILMSIAMTCLAKEKSKKNKKVWFEDRVELNQSAPLRKRFYNKKRYERVNIKGIDLLVDKEFYDSSAKPSRP